MATGETRSSELFVLGFCSCARACVWERKLGVRTATLGVPERMKNEFIFSLHNTLKGDTVETVPVTQTRSSDGFLESSLAFVWLRTGVSKVLIPAGPLFSYFHWGFTPRAGLRCLAIAICPWGSVLLKTLPTAYCVKYYNFTQHNICSSGWNHTALHPYWGCKLIWYLNWENTAQLWHLPSNIWLGASGEEWYYALLFIMDLGHALGIQLKICVSQNSPLQGSASHVCGIWFCWVYRKKQKESADNSLGNGNGKTVESEKQIKSASVRNGDHKPCEQLLRKVVSHEDRELLKMKPASRNIWIVHNTRWLITTAQLQPPKKKKKKPNLKKKISLLRQKREAQESRL